MSIPKILEHQLETEKVVVFNSSHIRTEDNELLTRITQGIQDESELMVDGHDYGFRVYVPVDYTDEDFQAVVNSALKEGLSEEFCNLLHISRAHKANWMKVDCDGLFYNQLPKFSW